jgi:hypothetical protein
MTWAFFWRWIDGWGFLIRKAGTNARPKTAKRPGLDFRDRRVILGIPAEKGLISMSTWPREGWKDHKIFVKFVIRKNFEEKQRPISWYMFWQFTGHWYIHQSIGDN